MRHPNPWVMIPCPRPAACLRLICIPYAGGASHVYSGWTAALPGEIEVLLVQLPGREMRTCESPFTRIDKLINEMLPFVIGQLDRRYAVFGHSMGAVIGFEMLKRIKQYRYPSPEHFFVSGEPAPGSAKASNGAICHLPDEDFIERIKQYNGVPRELLDRDDFMKLVLPVLRADFEMCETYRFNPSFLLDCPITVFGGSKDPSVHEDNLSDWRKHTCRQFQVFMIDGDHFFLNQMDGRRKLIDRINQTLSHCIQ